MLWAPYYHHQAAHPCARNQNITKSESPEGICKSGQSYQTILMRGTIKDKEKGSRHKAKVKFKGARRKAQIKVKGSRHKAQVKFKGAWLKAQVKYQGKNINSR